MLTAPMAPRLFSTGRALPRFHSPLPPPSRKGTHFLLFGGSSRLGTASLVEQLVIILPFHFRVLLQAVHGIVQAHKISYPAPDSIDIHMHILTTGHGFTASVGFRLLIGS
jgi:hypothetical protein